MPGYTRNDVSHGVSIHKYYYNYEDEIGSYSYWNDAIEQLFKEMPISDLWFGLDIWIYDMRHPLLPLKLKNKEQSLLDGDLNKDGYQVCAGLFFNKDKLEIAVFPEGWNTENLTSGNVTQSSIDKARNTLSHEVGHYYANQCGYASNSQFFIEKEITRYFDAFRPHQTESNGEDFAEVYHAYFGVNGAKGFFSDGKPFTSKGRLYCVMKTAYKLSSMLKNKVIDKVIFHDDYVEWEEYELILKYFLWFPYYTYSLVGKYSLDLNLNIKKLLT